MFDPLISAETAKAAYDLVTQHRGRRPVLEVSRPDYEVPVCAVIDYALSRSEADPERLALDGISFGGYFAPRAAVYDTLIKALLANSPIPDLHAYILGFVGHEISANPSPAARPA